MRKAKKPCACDLVALDSKGNEVPMHHPSATGVAYRNPPKHGGRAQVIPLCPLPVGEGWPWVKLMGSGLVFSVQVAELEDAERRKLESA